MVIKVTILSIASILVLFIITKIIGAREISQLSMFDYINGITIGSIAAEMATAINDSFLEPLLAMIVYAIVILFISFLTKKSITLRRFINGTAMVLLDDGVIYKDNFKRSRLDINEFLSECRELGYFSLNSIKTAILEPTGKLSIIPAQNKNEVTECEASLIVDGNILIKNLNSINKSKEWLIKKLNDEHINDVNNIILATYNKSKDKVYFYKKIKVDDSKNDIFI